MATKLSPSFATSAADLRRALATTHRAGVGRAYPSQLRTQVIALTRAVVAAGGSLSSVADSLNLPANTLGRWLSASPASSSFIPVALDCSMSAPTASRVPSAESDTAQPNWLMELVLDAFTYASCAQEVPDRAKT